MTRDQDAPSVPPPTFYNVRAIPFPWIVVISLLLTTVFAIGLYELRAPLWIQYAVAPCLAYFIADRIGNANLRKIRWAVRHNLICACCWGKPGNDAEELAGWQVCRKCFVWLIEITPLGAKYPIPRKYNVEDPDK